MDDIDDILASVDRDNVSLPEAAAIDHQVLTRFWVAERAVPEVLPWPGKLMDRIMERVRKQITLIEDLSLSAADTASSSSSNPNLNLNLCILQSDLPRTQYLIRSVLRQRLAKLTKYSLHYLRLSAPAGASSSSQSQSQSQSQTPLSQRGREAVDYGDDGNDNTFLSAQELAFLRSHHTLLSAHYASAFLSGFPPALRRLDDNAGGTSMITTPETKEVVFVRCLSEGGATLVVPADAPPAGPAGGSRGGTSPSGGWAKQEVLGYGATMKQGEVWVVRWEAVREAWEKGDVEIL